MWAAQLSFGESFTAGFSTIPFEITHHQDLTSTQWMSVSGERIAIPQAPGPHPISLTILSAMFMHGSWMHIIGNMMYLIIFGDQIEDLLGHLFFLIFYLVCGAAASAAHILGDPSSIIPSLGASGAISGVLGAYLIRFPRNPVRVLYYGRVIAVPASSVLWSWILFQIAAQLSVTGGEPTGVAYLAHIGGFAAGVLLILLFGRPRTESSY